ncbi:MAG: cyclic pyranopterin monophosphate synthase MoaC [bacterium]|nr:cyclic pyranopterin monophosphate synthase MoaC [bacterium]
MTDRLSHLNEKGRAEMVDVGDKDITRREAAASAKVKMAAETLKLISENSLPKGDVFSTARIAGIQAAKNTSGIIPLCHPLQIDKVSIDFEILEKDPSVKITAQVYCTGKTGVEMEALTAVSAAALTIYDMCKSVDKEITITDIMLISKKGGRSGDYKRG